MILSKKILRGKSSNTYRFNINLVNQELPPLSATRPIRHSNMANSQNQRAHKQSHLHASHIPSSTNIPQATTKHKRSLQRNINQRNHRTKRRDPQIRPSREPRPIAKAINTYIHPNRTTNKSKPNPQTKRQKNFNSTHMGLVNQNSQMMMADLTNEISGISMREDRKS